MIKLGVCGATGRMGVAACRAIEADPDTELLAAIGSSGSAEEFVEAGVDAVVDFTVAEAVRENHPVLSAAGVHAVIGTSGLGAADLDALRAGFVRSHCIVAPNFALSAVLMARFAALAAPFFDTAEVIEMHHERKTDAPSGTALATAEAMAEASPEWMPDPTASETLAGARGGRGPAGIPIHSVRLKGLVAHQQVMLGGAGETLTIRQDTIDRSAFMPGMLVAAKRVVAMAPGVTVGLAEVLGI
ncbi:MAG: 4-hydroxy-tetrahydrodipicolinate reductase [Acidimicrobiaceae bacterium]|nr:4-hydroxy-tetrahydrodipicolinate reductase [Acidimicrobiaceae bacterium]MCY4174999.1 4-hydroxy-tetrahydrodipicolinate reductase [Acidimicrobiaceae bacterium]MCY4279425.1 4-hydroxy-tetrahydrodipicolinate reductase [Acidimicrobiaceae bacterium]MCY4293676.1 4-hydroxy-tetrahydrodipicolinate reductase [Acidimicrobiaceae bacterium]